ncbi:hypothetical protein PB1_11274 [Bacillus methanolicus PB1]|uniref:Uncharacterized protein n=1 Tax=Bacillus methanolicus PB1 TaxID=997296 RepID=I3DV66_BACMT|nr:hypothetical protein [Bacillus methanolicus]EIJ78137.1 hypothetical protein PB1_11274 [Bacillus methanolicus PB1]
MTLYVNGKMEPKLYITQSSPQDPNQNLFHLNYVSQFIEQQQSVNQQLNDSFQEVNGLLKNAKSEQTNYFEEVLNRFEHQETFSEHLASLLKKHEQTSRVILERLHELEQLQKGIEKQAVGEGLVHQAILDQLSFQDQRFEGLATKLEEYGRLNQEFKHQLENQQSIFNDISQKLNNEEIYHKTVMERLDQQDALSHKLLRQLDHLKENIFERFSQISEQLQLHFRISASYFISFFSKRGIMYRTPPKRINKEEKVKNEARPL